MQRVCTQWVPSIINIHNTRVISGNKRVFTFYFNVILLYGGLGWWFTSPRPYGMVHGVDTILTKWGMSWFNYNSVRYGWIRPVHSNMWRWIVSLCAGALGGTCLFFMSSKHGFVGNLVQQRSSESRGTGLLGVAGSTVWSATLPRRPRTPASIRWLGRSFRSGCSLGETAITADSGCVPSDYRHPARRYKLATAGGLTSVGRQVV